MNETTDGGALCGQAERRDGSPARERCRPRGREDDVGRIDSMEKPLELKVFRVDWEDEGLYWERDVGEEEGVVLTSEEDVAVVVLELMVRADGETEGKGSDSVLVGGREASGGGGDDLSWAASIQEARISLRRSLTSLEKMKISALMHDKEQRNEELTVKSNRMRTSNEVSSISS